MTDRKTKTITAYKGFDENLQCRGYQYEVGKTYEHKGRVELCDSGFHACTSPLDVWGYYGPLDARFAEVELTGQTATHGQDSKVAAAKITIKAELTLPQFIRHGVELLIDATKGKTDDGDDAKIGSSGDSARIGSSGDDAKIGSSGDRARIGSSGHFAKIGSTGDNAKIGSSGHYARIGSSGHRARIGSTGDNARIGSSGHRARIGSTGDNARIGSSGRFAKIGSTGDDAKIGSSGDSAWIGSSGHYARIDSSGENSVIASAGPATRARGADGTWISLAEYVDGKCVGFATGCIGEKRLKPDTWYVASGGKLVKENQR